MTTQCGENERKTRKFWAETEKRTGEEQDACKSFNSSL